MWARGDASIRAASIRNDSMRLKLITCIVSALLTGVVFTTRASAYSKGLNTSGHASVNLASNASTVAVCSCGTLNSLRNVVLQANLKLYVLDRLNATSFLHYDVAEDAGAYDKEIFPTLPLHDSEVPLLLQRLETRGHAEHHFKVPDSKEFTCKPSTSQQRTIINAVSLALPLFEHAIGCLELVRAHEIKYNKKFTWLIFTTTHSLFFPGGILPKEMYTPPSMNPAGMAYVDLYGTNLSKVGGRVTAVTLDIADDYVHVMRRLMKSDCAQLSLIATFCGKHMWPEFILGHYWHQRRQSGTRVNSVWPVLPFDYSRRCGTWVACHKIAQDICKNTNGSTCSKYYFSKS
jgi:hypothetical protein